MAVFSARERLTRLVELAGRDGAEARRALAGELADLLLGWPSIYPRGMREPFEALLEKTIRDVGADARASLAERFGASEDAPLSILNLLVFDAPPETRRAILERNAAAAEKAPGLSRIPINETALLAAARAAPIADLASVLAPRLGIPLEIAQQILDDRSAAMLALLSKGAGLRRPVFSALVVLAWPHATSEESYRRLAGYDDVPEAGARALFSFWRLQQQALPTESQAA